MINKENFISFIEKYFLAGENETSVVEITDDEIKTSLESETSKIISYISLKNFKMPDCKIGIYSTSKLLGTLNLMVGSDVNVKEFYQDGSDTEINLLQLNDGKKTVKFPTMETDLISNVFTRKPKKEDVLAHIDLNTDVINELLQSQAVIGTANLAFLKQPAPKGSNEDDKLIVVFGYSDKSNQLEVRFPLAYTGELGDFDVVLYDAIALRKILAVNKGNFKESYIEMFDSKMKLYFADKDITAEYYVSPLQTNQND